MLFRSLLLPLKRLVPTLSVEKLLQRVANARTPKQLTHAMNRLQNRLWKHPEQAQKGLKQREIQTLSRIVTDAIDADMRIEAARWLRLFVQSGQTTQPADIFATLVMATRQAAEQGSTGEQSVYLSMIFECFWPFRYPYAIFTWQDFPPNELFYPLAPLIKQNNVAICEALFAIFSELPTLDDADIADHLLPIALIWATHSDPEYRRSVTNILARINLPAAQETFCRLQNDPDPLVYTSANRAAAYVQRV